MLYGMSLIYGFTGTTVLVEIGHQVNHLGSSEPIVSLAIVFMIIGFAFKVSAVPFHTWAPDTYEGAPTPVAAFLATASKAAGFVALMELIFVGFYGRHDVYEPLMWVLAAASMTVGNLIALRQTNVVRMLAYSGIAQAGYIWRRWRWPAAADRCGADAAAGHGHLPGHLRGHEPGRLRRGHRRGPQDPHRPSSTSFSRPVPATRPAWPWPWLIFLASLAGIPPMAGWFAKFVHLPRPGRPAGRPPGYVLAVVVGVNSVIAALLLPASDPLHVHGGRHRRRPRPDPGAGVADHRPGAHRRHHAGLRASSPATVTHFTDTVHFALGR